ncbi:SNF2-related protein [Luteimonas sp. MHLX1A]|uniref:SNF2-related protein n=1 Tax=Alterluteimonas muca TaxID=2878684 RepID=UPI001E3B07E7|nr:SNF2-related protein [Luteimonas sp. MHLX1A]MCD9046893.1 hypothetical protein [Luteimonas sp. MHLX1A]
MSWAALLDGLLSRGSQAQRPGSLAGLAAARRVHEGQFWTPTPVAALMWRIAGQAMAGVERTIHLFDNAVGSGRLVQFATPGTHTVSGMDVDGRCIERLVEAAREAGLQCDLLCAGMEDVTPGHHDLGLLNPPFSISLSSPGMAPYECTTWGAHGPHTQARSHDYAIEQALECCPVVVAVVPDGFARTISEDPPDCYQGRLRAVVDLPRGCFRQEGTEVAVSLLVFGPFNGRGPRGVALRGLDDDLPDFEIAGSLSTHLRKRPMKLSREEDDSQPAITGDVMGDTTVRIVHRGRWIYLKTRCALTEAKVRNAILRKPVDELEGHRYPERVRYAGQGRLDVELMLMQDDPQAAFDSVIAEISKAGGTPVVDPGLVNYFRKRMRAHAIARRPFGHWIQGTHATSARKAKAKCKRVLDRSVWGSPIIQAGQEVDVTPSGGGYVLQVGQHQAHVDERELLEDFDVAAAAARTEDGWSELHPSREAAAPDHARQIRAELARCGAGAVASWGYQQSDLVEGLLGRHFYAAHSMGLGKGRLSIALAMLPGKHHAIAVDSYLVDGLIDQLNTAGVDSGLWQVIRTPEQCRDLRKINIIAYETLRRPIVHGAGRRTYARLLRRRFCTVVCDEAQLLRHHSTAQTRAIWMLSPRRRVAMSGTPKPNFVQDLLAPLQWVYGDGTALQPYGRFNPFLEPRLFSSMTAAARGIDAFQERHVVVEWVTREWADGLEKGAKRQVPKIQNAPQLREWLAPLIKRRVETEPDVRSHFKATVPVFEHVELDWKRDHFRHYLRVADLFKQWYESAIGNSKRMPSTVMLLARIAAVVRASNTPQHRSDSELFRSIPTYAGLTSKQEYVLDRLEGWTAEGRKSICYADSPFGVNLYVRELHKRGIDALGFHGGQSIARRNADLRSRFMSGPVPVLVASIQTIERGHNLYCASRGIFACRSWGGSTEWQGSKRMCRPEQTEDVVVVTPVLQGSIDCYQHQVTSMKVGSARSVLDYIDDGSDDEFLHLDKILGTFVEDLAQLAGMDAGTYREQLRAA